MWLCDLALRHPPPPPPPLPNQQAVLRLQTVLSSLEVLLRGILPKQRESETAQLSK